MARRAEKRAGRRAGSFRTCVACRRRRPHGYTYRVVRSADGQLLPDLFQRLPGRGAHLCPDLACFVRAAERNAFGHAFRAPVARPDPDALAGRFLDASWSQCRALLATALRAGWLIAGNDEVVQAIRAGRAALCLLAEDASPRSTERIRKLAAGCGTPFFRALRKAELARFHHGKPLAACAVPHRGVARSLASELTRAIALRDSLADRDGPTAPADGSTDGLTRIRVRGKLPPTRSKPAQAG
ncbi:MAG: DUF448 domain-containing protein [Deltaproteobacteria bacterium]|nr:DUF448 domain-containing protein [Deltaproteobacteria bacterium]